MLSARRPSGMIRLLGKTGILSSNKENKSMKRHSLYLTLSLLALFLLLLPGCLIQTSQSKQVDARVAELQQRVEQLEQENADLRQRFDDSSRVAGEAYVGFERLQQEVQVLQGRFDEVTHNNTVSGSQVQSMRRQMAAELNRISRRLEKVEKQLGITYTGGAVGDIDTAMEEEEQMNKAMALFNQGNLEAAKAQFGEFLLRFKNSTQRDKAQYFLAECYFKQRNWEEAILAFDTLVNNYPQSEFVPGGFLRMGICFYENGQISDARLFFKKVIDTYPNSKEAEIAKKKLRNMR